ncbi:MAG: hypothetical protein AB7O04_13305 [Hyphomonadaceae bacterium]
MNLKIALAALLILPVVACGGGARTRTAEMPGGGPADGELQPGQRPTGWLNRVLGDENTPNVGPCPLMGVLYDSARIVEFASAEERYANIRFTGEMRGVRGFCRYVGADPIEMNLEIDMAFGRGPAAESDRRVYRYWVAVTRRGVAPIEKQYFDIEVRFENGEPVRAGTEQIQRIVIPRATPEISGDNFEVLVGFELTPEQLQFNRDGKRFRIDAAGNVQG